MKYYYVNRSTKTVQVYTEKSTDTGLEFLGKTDNPSYKMAAATFLKYEVGYKILINF